MKQKLATPPLPNAFDMNENIKWIEALVAALIAWITFIIFYFKHKAKEKQDFIENVVKATLSNLLDHELQGIKDNVATLFKYREEDRKHIDEKFSKMGEQFQKAILELKK